MKKRQYLIIFIIVATLTSCGSVKKVTTLNNETGHFPAKENKTVTTLKSLNINPDTLQSLIIVPNETYWIEMIKNMHYFKEVMTFPELQKAIIDNGLTDKIPNVSDRIGLNRAYNYYKPFVILSPTKIQKPGEGWFAGLAIYDPKTATNIFQNEISLNLMWDGWTDQGTMYPLFNSMLDYLKIQK